MLAQRIGVLTRVNTRIATVIHWRSASEGVFLERGDEAVWIRKQVP